MATNAEARFSTNFLDEEEVAASAIPAVEDPSINATLEVGVVQESESKNPFSAFDSEPAKDGLVS